MYEFFQCLLNFSDPSKVCLFNVGNRNQNSDTLKGHSAATVPPSKQSLNLLPLVKEIHCPTSVASLFKFITPPNVRQTTYTCPTLVSIGQERLLPTPDTRVKIDAPTHHQTHKMEAQMTTLKWRHKKMKKHRLRVMRYQNTPTIRAMKMYKARKKAERDLEDYENMRREGDAFDAEAHVRKLLTDAKRGGYKVDVFKERAEELAREKKEVE